MYDEVRQKQLCVQYPTVKWVLSEDGSLALRKAL